MKRYEGFFRGQPSEANWPARWWIVAIQLGTARAENREGLRRSSLSGWSAGILDCDGPRCYSRSLLSGSTAGDFWTRFISQDRAKGPLWIISPRALMAWQTLGLWQMIETGNLNVLPSAPTGFSNAPVPEGTRLPGMLLTDDPPTAGKFATPDGGLVFRWVCANNFGLAPLSSGESSHSEMMELSEAVLGASKMLADFRLGGWGITASSIALAGWQQSYNGPPLYYSSGPSGDPLEQAAIAGGLLLAKETGDNPVTAYAVDARSQYPWIAAHYPQATNMEKRGLQQAEAEKAVNANPLGCLARVRVKTDLPRYPQRLNGIVGYPTGEFEACLCGPELLEAKKAGDLLEILAANTYQLGTPLADYETRCWTARQSCDTGSYPHCSSMIKRLGVSLIGKLLQRSIIWRETEPSLNDPLWGSWTDIALDGTAREYRSRAGIVECQIGEQLTAHAIPSIPLWVWSWGRVRLWRWILIAGAETVFYADTDGMLLSEAGYRRLASRNILSSGGWGCLRLVSGPQPCTIRGSKNFTLGERIVCAGWPKAQRAADRQPDSAAWYRLPWSKLSDPGANNTWIEELR